MNYYQLLQISEDASLEAIQTAYKALTKKYRSNASELKEISMSEINTAYEVLSDKQKRKAYDRGLKNRPKNKNRFDKQGSASGRSFSYMGSVLNIDASLAKVATWKSSIIDAGIVAAQNYIQSYKAIMNGYGKVQSVVGLELINIGLDLLIYHMNTGLRKGVSVVQEYGIHDQNELKKARAYLSKYIKDSAENCAHYYRNTVSNNNTNKLTDLKLSNMAYKVYNIYLNIERGVGNYLKEKGLLKIPTTSIEQATFSLNCENEARELKIRKGDRSVFDPLFRLILTTPDRIESYCLLYYLYGDDKKELEQIADFFGMKKQYICYKDTYCKNNLRIEEGQFFSQEVNQKYTPINWEIFGSYYSFYRDFARKCDVSDKEAVDGFIKASSDEIRKHLYTSKSELLAISCNNENDIFTSSTVFWAAMALLSMHLDELTEEQYRAWANKNHNILKESLLAYYNLAKEKQNKYTEELAKRNHANSSSCFITTAVCNSFGKPDDCYELQSFRWFRDNWLINQSDGKELIAEYYEAAPKIVERINERMDRKIIYKRIWIDYLCLCLNYIEAKKYGQCKELYEKMVNALKHEYLPCSPD